MIMVAYTQLRWVYRRGNRIPAAWREATTISVATVAITGLKLDPE
jgi:hypothetical protein